MSASIYREEQAVRESFIPLVMIPAWLVLVGVFTWGFYEQLVKGRPWGDEPMSNTALLVTGIGSILAVGIFMMILINSRLVLEVKSDGFYYSFAPFVRRMKQIKPEEIASAGVIKFSLFSRVNRRGVHHNVFSRTTSYSLGGSKGLEIVTKRGKRLVFSVKRPEDMQHAIRLMMESVNA